MQSTVLQNSIKNKTKMKYITPALLALAVPANAYTFGTFPADSLFTALARAEGACQPPAGRCEPAAAARRLFTSPGEDLMAVRQGRRRRRDSNMFNRALQTNSPSYQIVDNEDMFQVQLDVPGVNVEDLKINLEDDGKMLTLSGSREKTADGYSYTSQFSQSFFLEDPTIDADQFSANLQNGVLIVSAPKDSKKLEEAIRSIPITELSRESTEIKSETSEAENKDSVPSSIKEKGITDGVTLTAEEQESTVATAADETIDLDAPATEPDDKACNS